MHIPGQIREILNLRENSRQVYIFNKLPPQELAISLSEAMIESRKMHVRVGWGIGQNRVTDVLRSEMMLQGLTISIILLVLTIEYIRIDFT